MTNIRSIRAFRYSPDKEDLFACSFETRLRADGQYYFRNSFIEIPNEFRTAPIYFPKLFFSLITAKVEWVLKNRDEDISSETVWRFLIDYEDGTQKSVEEKRQITGLDPFLDYNNFISFSDTEWGSRNIATPPRSKKIALEDVRGEVAVKSITLERLVDRLAALLRGSREDSVEFKEDEGISIFLKQEAKTGKERIVEIGHDGYIESTGEVLYVDILKENNVIVLFSADAPSLYIDTPQQDLKLIEYLGFFGDKLLSRAFPILPEAIKMMYRHPAYVMDDPSFEYSFANKNEYLLFCRRFRSNGKVVWNSSDKYLDHFYRAYDCFEDSDYDKAISFYNKCLEINPIAIQTRFELANCYIKQGKFGKAKISLAVLKDLLFFADDIGKFYRMLGFIYCEEGLYRLAYACYKYSRKMGGWYDIKDELNNEYIYIRYKAKRAGERDYERYSVMDCEEELRYGGVPIIRENRKAVEE